MKKTLFSLLLIMAPVVMFAQLKVHRNGNVTIGQQTQSKISKLSIGGTVTTDGIVVPIRINAKDMSKSLNNQDGVNTLSSMMSVGVFSYSIPSEAIDDEKATPSSDFHYAISPDELQSLFPSLVCEDSDGTKSINYTELVPLLLRSIQELKQELDMVKGSGSRMTRSLSNDDWDSQTEEVTGNVLYQNTPNPFKEQTTIRFSLSDDVRDAAICIFDLSGKMLKKVPISSGETSVSINGWELGEGMFLYTLMVGGQEIDTKRMIITK